MAELSHRELKNLSETTSDLLNNTVIENIQTKSLYDDANLRLVITCYGRGYYISFNNKLSEKLFEGTSEQCELFLKGILFTLRLKNNL